MTEWNQKEIAALKRAKVPGKSWADISMAVGTRSPTACRKKWKRLGVSSPDLDSPLERWRSAKPKLTWQEIVQHAKRGADLQSRFHSEEVAAKRIVKTNEDIYICFMSDFHFGSPYVDYEAFLKTADLLMDRRFLFAVVGPDLESAFTWFRDASAVLNQVIPPAMQLEAYRLWLDSMIDRCVGVWGDNHSDRRLKKMVGDIGVLWRDDVPYFGEFGFLDLELVSDTGTVNYNILAAHKYRGGSSWHNFQPCLRMMREIDPFQDVYVTAHTHSPAYMNSVFWSATGRSPQHLIVCGTWKTGFDPYTKRFGSRGVLGLPTLKLSPDKKKIVYYDSPETALEP